MLASVARIASFRSRPDDKPFNKQRSRRDPNIWSFEALLVFVDATFCRCPKFKGNSIILPFGLRKDWSALVHSRPSI